MTTYTTLIYDNNAARMIESDIEQPVAPQKNINMNLLELVTPASMALHEPPLVKYLHLSDRSIAYRHLEGKSPTLIYVGGFLSTMEIHKATIIEQYAKVHGRASIRYDQARHFQT